MAHVRCEIPRVLRVAAKRDLGFGGLACWGCHASRICVSKSSDICMIGMVSVRFG
jgi:hypothetical protein